MGSGQNKLDIRGSRLILTHSAPLRMLTLLLFYFTQGFPVGLFFFAVPAWMASSGASTAQVAGVVGLSALPWSLKLVNGFLLDRYTFLPMGRRRVWIIGAQSLIVLVLLGGAVLAPDAHAVFVLSAIGFAANLAVTFQDVGIDSLAVDIMAESERAKAGGIMFGAQSLGIAAATALGGLLLQEAGFATCMAVCAIVPFTVLVYGVVIREREGERRLPWSDGASHPHNLAIQVEAWWPLLVNGMRAVAVPLSLALIPILLLRSMPTGAGEAFHPVLATETAGWALSEYTNVQSVSNLVWGLLGLVVGGWAIDGVGAQRSTLILMAMAAGLMAAMGLAQAFWTNALVLTGYLALGNFFDVFVAIAIIPLCMRMCSPAVAATQFTIYMAISNFGRPLGASLAAATAGAGVPQWMYFALALLWMGGVALLLLVRFPTGDAALHKAALVLPQGEGLAPIRN